MKMSDQKIQTFNDKEEDTHGNPETNDISENAPASFPVDEAIEDNSTLVPADEKAAPQVGMMDHDPNTSVSGEADPNDVHPGTTEETTEVANIHAQTETYTQDSSVPENVYSAGETTAVVTSFKPASPEEKSATATVKVMLLPDGYVMTVAFAIGLTTDNLKEHFTTELKIPPNVLQITFNGDVVEDSKTLMDLGVRPHGTIQLEMFSTDPQNYPIKPIKPQQEYNMPDVITVRVQKDADTYQDVVVEIERTTQRKAFLGGYRHKITGLEFHHAGVQTISKKRPDNGIEKFCRNTQTVREKSQHQQVTYTTSTQMTKIGCYVSNTTDKLISPGEYFTADEYHNRRLKAVIVIQTYARRWHAIRLVKQLSHDRMVRLDWEKKEEQRKKKEKEDRLKREYERRMHPKTKEDFDLLYHALEKWRQEELEDINATLTGAERKAALCALLEQETQLIASIGRHKLDANEEIIKNSVQAFLEKCSEPKKWKAFDDKITEMDTQYTIRARELKDIYATINMKHLTQDERLDVLLTLKHTVKEHKCKLTEDIVELIDREADLLMRGVKESNLEGLRKRISTLFLQYIKTPTFNPEVARLLKVPQDPSLLHKNIYFCPGCRRYLRSTEFSLTANSRTTGRCHQCNKLDNVARQREDLNKYKNMLTQLRQAEAEYDKKAKIAFLLQDQDLQYLLRVIWATQSALSAWDDLYDLVMVRWNKYVEWSPWNCILLTKEEAATHLKLDNVEQAYGVVFIRKVKHKHTLAKKYFSQIPTMAQFLHSRDSQPAAPGNDLLVTKPAVTQA
ncbi:IQ and ubiquitin-like domain-containing protein [Acipenser oxyrinchus oxyrinchus]|uniref:IQ and ubiquitin-like domain-containing protein n=1 Tax=Acipenser oxyrinchus oxyrinchus TaxID=40147 RepID=A0AAD8DF92_ACIOX|nr:IQ and ubiquitin-like domain-containing protein [Acipenser oxyrinchus oxyrinchus]